MVKEHESFTQMQPYEEVYTVYDSESEKKLEHYEGLLKMARSLDLPDQAAESLQENPSEECRHPDRIENISRLRPLQAPTTDWLARFLL